MTQGVMASVNQRTQLVGQNRMEMLMFRLPGSDQLFGINVFKVREVTQCPKLTVIPNSHPVIRGIADFRGTAIPVIDFGRAIGRSGSQNLEEALVIISEYNRTVQALIVDSVERIVNLTWESIKPPPAGAQGVSGSYLTAVTQVDDHLIEIIDVERIIDEVQPSVKDVSATVQEELHVGGLEKEPVVLVADDSAVARSQMQRCLESIGVKCIAVSDGQQALDILLQMKSEGKKVSEELAMLISDVEMPVMDGYTLTTEVRMDEALKDLHVILHTSLSGVFNTALIEKVGADNFVSKFQPDILAQAVESVIRKNKTKTG